MQEDSIEGYTHPKAVSEGFHDFQGRDAMRLGDVPAPLHPSHPFLTCCAGRSASAPHPRPP